MNHAKTLLIAGAVALICGAAACGNNQTDTDTGNDVITGDTLADPGLPADPGTPEDIGTTDSMDTADDDGAADLFEPVTDAWTPETVGLDTAGPADDVELPDGVRVKVGSYNLYGYHWADAEHIGALVKSLDVDLMGLVESNEDQVAAVAAAAGYQHYCSNGDGRSLLSKTPLAECTTITLVGGRTLLRTETEIDGVTFAVYVMHIDWDIIGNQQTREFMDNFFDNETRSHVVLMGDYNDEHLSRQMMIMEEQLADAFTAFGWYPGERVTWPSVYFDDTEGSQTIDLIFFRKSLRPIVLAADAVNLSPNLSDHKPVWAEMLFPRNDTPFADALTMSKIDPYRVFGADPADMPANLVTNPGAEQGLDGWTVEGGAVATTQRYGCTAGAGTKFFAGLEKNATPDLGYSRLTQVIDLSGSVQKIDTNNAWLYVSGEMITCPALLTEGDITTNRVERYDDAEMTVTFIDAWDHRTDRHVSKRRDTLAWYPWADVIPIPPATRKVELALTTHKRIDYVGGIDGGFDNLYVSVDSPRLHPLNDDGNLLRFGMDETAVGDTADSSIGNDGWITRTTGTPLSLNGFPPASVSGLKYLFAGDEVGLNPVDGPIVLSQEISVAELQDHVATDSNIALRWGGWTRTNTAEGAMVTMYLQLLDGNGDIWAEVPGETIWQSEWLYTENLTRLPIGIRSVRFMLKAEIPVFTKFPGIDGLEAQDDAVFADELFVRPELIDLNSPGIE